ncbi:DinB family protein [Pelagibius sp. CAU 1746]|uniref:DinB family protein n=1 Tax=Pelagibius sp. CAU 1746 TaxID=3140370 RepID=UPI00325B5223
MEPESYLLAQARNNAWANCRLLRACASLPQPELEAPRTGFFPSLLATLNHILIVDWYYVDALEGGTLGLAAFIDEVPCKTPSDLCREQESVDRRLIRLCEGLNESALGATVRLIRRDGDRFERCDRVLLHLFEHQIHHRGQAHAMLSGTSVAPPQLDEFFLDQDAGMRRGDLEALGGATQGWSEAELWGDWPKPDAG